MNKNTLKTKVYKFSFKDSSLNFILESKPIFCKENKFKCCLFATKM